VKANADPVLMRLFVLLGYGFDCSTEGEIRLALKSGADPKKIIFAHTIKARKALKYASSVGVDLMTFDCKEELLKINQDFPTASFHVGALCESSETFVSAIENSRLVFSLAERHGFKFTILDIGSGFFGSKEKESFFYELTQEIKTSLEKNFPTEDIEIIAEPGCYCVASAFSLVTSIIGKKSIAQNGNNGLQKEYYLNDGFYGSFPYFYKDYDVKHVPLLTPAEVEIKHLYESKIWGQTCCCEDVILEKCLLPDMEEGQLILWKNMGAYIRGLPVILLWCHIQPIDMFLFKIQGKHY
ncbi:ornithine decarboxylase, partial [Trichonephila clavata]